MAEFITFIYTALFSANTIWSVVVRALLWFAISIVIIASMDKPKPDESFKKMKSNLGFFFFFVVLSGTLVWMLFGFVTTS